MITALLLMAASVQQAKPILLNCVIRSENEDQKFAVFLDPNSADDVYDPSDLLRGGNRSVTTTEVMWPFSRWTWNNNPYYSSGPHGELLGPFGGVEARIDEVDKKRRTAVLTMKNFYSAPNNHGVHELASTVKGACNWIDGEAAQQEFLRIKK
jgi:hypothetical protein